ncbi:MAG: DUF3037 domain-containing protein [Enterovibrio sp.]
MKTLVRYTIIRFMPFAETQEFANVGVILHAPQTGDVLFKLAPTRFGRVSQFFDDLDGQLYKNAIEMFNAELARITTFSKGMYGQQLVNFMNEVTRQREGFLIFSETSTFLATDTLQSVLNDLFDLFVARRFNSKEQRDIQLVRDLKKQLEKTRYPFKTQIFDADCMSFELPLVASDNITVKAIKPLSFYQKTPLGLMDYGERWLYRVELLLEKETLKEDDFLFAIEYPEHYETCQQEKAANHLTNKMKRMGVNVCSVSDHADISEFAKFDSEKDLLSY